MSDTISRRSMMTSPPLVMMMLVGIALLIAALVMWSWREAGWGAFVWLAVSVALVAIRTPHLVRNHTNQIVVRCEPENFSSSVHYMRRGLCVVSPLSAMMSDVHQDKESELQW